MITPKRPPAAPEPAPAGSARARSAHARPSQAQSTQAGILLAFVSCAIALITLGLSLAEDLGPAPFAALIAAEVVLIAGMGALFGMMHAAGTAPAAAGDAARLRRDEETLDALEPLRPEEHGSGQR